MPSSILKSAAFVVFAALSVVLPASNSSAQNDFAGEGGIFPNFSLGATSDEPATWNAEYAVVPGGEAGVLKVEVTLGSGWHIYSMTQPPGGPLKTELSIEAPKAVQLSGKFKPDREPAKSISKDYDGLTIEEFADGVTWSAPIIVPAGYKGDIKIAVDGLTCTDAGKCMPVSEVLVAKFAGPAEAVAQNQVTAKPAAAVKLAALKQRPYREPRYPVQWTAVASKAIPAGGRGVIQFTATPDAGYHVYTAAIDDAGSSTNFVVTKKSGLKIAAPSTPEKKILDKILSVYYHKSKVTWSLPVQVPAGTAPGMHDVEGFIVYQACTENACSPPTGLKFRTTIAVGDAGNQAVVVEILASSRGEGLDAAAETKWVDKLDAVTPAAKVPVGKTPAANTPAVAPAATDQSRSIKPPVEQIAVARSTPNHSSPEPNGEHATGAAPTVAAPSITAAAIADSPEVIAEMAKLYNPNEKIRYVTYSEMDANPIGSGGLSSGNKTTFWSAMFGAFVGGILLNLMPCVFPVLGLKVMSFVKQAGSDPAKIRKHGLAFAGGLIVAMWILAGIILTIKLSLGQDINWGAQMGNPYFVCSMIVLLFLLGLNMAGVFEFGTSLTQVGGAVQGKEGYSASFLSGVLTTLVATPCSGPFLGAAMSYTLAQTAGIAMILFTVFALGIALPYLLLSFFPVLISKLPRPGAWMETFKVTMAFALFATVAFFMQAFGNQTGVNGLAWLAMALVVIGLAAYYYGNWTAPHVPVNKRWVLGYAMPLAIACVGGWMCYSAASERRAPGSSVHAGGLAWQDWNPGKVSYTLEKSKRPIWVDYTAHW